MSLRRAAASGVLWTAAGTAVATGLRLVSLAVIARTLSHAEFGMAAMLLAIVATMQAFSDFGLSAAIVQRASLTREQLSGLFWIAQLAGVATCAAVVLLEPVVVAFYDQPALGGLVAPLALRFVIAPAGIPFQAILQRELRFRGSFAIQAGAAAIGAAVTIGGALGGFGIWALIGGELASALAASALALALGWRHWRPQLRFSRTDLRGPLGTGFYQVGERAANLFATNIDYVVVGRVLGPEALALYAVAFELTSLPARLNQVVLRVAFPVLTRRQHDPDGFRRGYFELMRVVALVQLPLIVGIGLLAPLLVPVFFGADWAGAIPLVQILALFGAFRALGNPSGPVFLARGRADLGFKFNLVVAPAALAAFALAAPHGADAVAWSWVALGAAQLAALVVIQGHLVGFAAGAWLAAIARPALLASLAAGFLVAARALVEALSLPAGIGLVVVIAVAAAALAPAAWKLEGPFLRTWLAAARRDTTSVRP